MRTRRALLVIRHRRQAAGMNALSRREEDTLAKVTKARALRECDPVVKAFAKCAEGRTVSVAWACKEPLKVVQECMMQYTAPEPMEAIRKEYLRLRREQTQNMTPPTTA
ncbi:hypothetical protein FA13DRAFT_460431 [Coprinellus micaceus]|uniref:COX assembly mitochondrial protein n=1 Tax=Coprinellus micaceus TaxID=71717 RepID=A0A4Y7TYK5_COPMI|nr:hypothetical protein FA13DRAFT_460431 [Coprinellus micaceus]